MTRKARETDYFSGLRQLQKQVTRGVKIVEWGEPKEVNVNLQPTLAKDAGFPQAEGCRGNKRN